MSAPVDESARLEIYRETLRQKLRELESRTCRLVVPPSRHLWDRRFRIPFHPTPEVFFQIAGSTHFNVPEGKFILNAGEIGIIPRGLPHHELGRADDQGYCLMVGMFLTNCLSFHLAKLLPDGQITGEYFDRFQAKDHAQIADLINDIATAYQELNTTSHPKVRGLLMGYLGWSLSRCDKPVENSTLEPPLVRRCRDKVEAEMGSPDLCVLAVARSLGCTPNHLSRLFQQVTRIRLTRYIHEVRLARAVQLLKHSNLKISSIALDCGFKSHRAFDRVFHQHMGFKPKLLRGEASYAGGMSPN